MSLFSFLFPTRPEETSTWKQEQQEALVDLLYLSIYIDGHLSLIEEKKVEEELKHAEWDGPKSSLHYMEGSVTRARNVKSNQSLKTDYLTDIANRLAEKRVTALEALDKVLSSDGTSEREATFLQEVRSAFEL